MPSKATLCVFVGQSLHWGVMFWGVDDLLKWTIVWRDTRLAQCRAQCMVLWLAVEGLCVSCTITLIWCHNAQPTLPSIHPDCNLD